MKRIAFVPPRVDEDLVEWERDAVGEVHFKPLVWSLDPPRVKRAANFYVGRPGEAEYIMIRVQPGDEYGTGLRWFGPLPEPLR